MRMHEFLARARRRGMCGGGAANVIIRGAVDGVNRDLLAGKTNGASRRGEIIMGLRVSLIKTCVLAMRIVVF